VAFLHLSKSIKYVFLLTRESEEESCVHFFLVLPASTSVLDHVNGSSAAEGQFSHYVPTKIYIQSSQVKVSGQYGTHKRECCLGTLIFVIAVTKLFTNQESIRINL
jgi:hypothetical protein